MNPTLPKNIEWICIHDRICLKDSLPTEYGDYLVIRGHFYKSWSGQDKGVITYEVAVAKFHPKRFIHGGHWYDSGFFYTHWYGPISMPDMKRFPILSAENPCNNPSDAEAR
jgi:hypothetical protein